MKSSFGEASKLYDQTQELRNSIDDIEKTIERLKDEASKLSEKVRTGSSPKASSDVKDKAIAEANSKIKSLTTAVSNLEDQIEKLRKKAGTEKGKGKK